MNESLALVVGIMLTSGVIAGMIAYSRVEAGGVFLGFFILGALLPLVGIVCALLSKPRAAGGWYADPWGLASWRWHDGTAWTAVVNTDSTAKS